MPVIVITGAAGLTGSMLRPRLARPGRTLRLVDLAPLTAGLIAAHGEPDPDDPVLQFLGGEFTRPDPPGPVPPGIATSA